MRVLLRASRFLICLAPVLVGCYSYTYSPTTPVPGIRLSLQLNDQGRYELANHIGPGVDRIEGWLLACADSQYTLRVEQTIGLAGGTVPWSGERVNIRMAYVSNAREKRFSAPRTIVLAGTVTASIVTFIATRGLLGLGGGTADTPPVSNNGH